MKSKAIILALILGLGLISITGCKKDSGFGGFRCYSSSAGFAYFFIGDNYKDGNCSMVSSVFGMTLTSVSTIPTTNLIANAGCYYYKGTSNGFLEYAYINSGLTVETFQSHCASKSGYWDTTTKAIFSAKELKF